MACVMQRPPRTSRVHMPPPRPACALNLCTAVVLLPMRTQASGTARFSPLCGLFVVVAEHSFMAGHGLAVVVPHPTTRHHRTVHRRPPWIATATNVQSKPCSRGDSPVRLSYALRGGHHTASGSGAGLVHRVYMLKSSSLHHQAVLPSALSAGAARASRGTLGKCAAAMCWAGRVLHASRRCRPGSLRVPLARHGLEIEVSLFFTAPPSHTCCSLHCRGRLRRSGGGAVAATCSRASCHPA